MGKNNYKERIVHLKESGVADDEIALYIYREYGIRIAVRVIRRIAEKVGSNSEKSEYSLEAAKIKMIKSVLSSSIFPLSAMSICSRIVSTYGERISKKEVNKLIYHHLKNEINYDRFNFTYSLKANLFTESHELNYQSSENNVKHRLTSLFGSPETHDLAKSIKAHFKNQLIYVTTGIEKMDYLIKAVVKDNIITDCEEIFLKSKAHEMGYSADIISDAKNSLEQNNPYLDNIIHIIFDDGIITADELVFLREKAFENNFNPSFVNERFWVLGLAEYFGHLIKLDSVKELLILYYFLYRLDKNKYSQELFFESVDIYKEKDLSISCGHAKKKFSSELDAALNAKYSDKMEYSKYILNNYSLDSQGGELDSTEQKDGAIDLKKFLKILNQERIRIGSADVNLLVENINYRIENNLWD